MAGVGVLKPSKGSPIEQLVRDYFASRRASGVSPQHARHLLLRLLGVFVLRRVSHSAVSSLSTELANGSGKQPSGQCWSVVEGAAGH